MNIRRNTRAGWWATRRWPAGRHGAPCQALCRSPTASPGCESWRVTGMETAFPLAGNGTGPRWLPPALRVRCYRWFWSAQWPVLLGTWMQTVALGYFVYTQTRSVNAVAFVAAASGLPALALSVFGGALADRYPRRRILLVTQSTLGLGAATLAILALTGHFSLVAIVVVAVVFGSSAAVDLPTSQALGADLVSRDLAAHARSPSLRLS